MGVFESAVLSWFEAQPKGGMHIGDFMRWLMNLQEGVSEKGFRPAKSAKLIYSEVENKDDIAVLVKTWCFMILEFCTKAEGEQDLYEKAVILRQSDNRSMSEKIGNGFRHIFSKKDTYAVSEALFALVDIYKRENPDSGVLAKEYKNLRDKYGFDWYILDNSVL